MNPSRRTDHEPAAPAVVGAKAGQAFAAIALCAVVAGAKAQTPAPLADPHFDLVTNGQVNAMVRQANGGVIIGGVFSSVNGYGRGNLARIKPDGTLDLAWNPSANDRVDTIAIDAASGDVYVGGRFSVIGGRNRAHLAKITGISSAGAVDANWNPSSSGDIYGLAVNSAGDVYACGYFSTIGGQTRNSYARLSGTGTGTAYAAWNAVADGYYCNAMALDSNGDVFVSGDFANIGGQARAGLAKLTAGGNGAADANWNPNPSNTTYVAALATNGAGALYVGGNFTSIGGQTRDGLAKLSTSGTGAADATWNPGNCCVYGVHVGADGKIYVGGGFSSVGGVARPRLARLSPNGAGAADPTWTPTMDSAYLAFFSLLADAGGNAYIASGFSDISGQRRLSLAQVDATGAVIGPATDVEKAGTVKAILRQPGGGAIIGGSFLKAGGATRNHLLRVNADGTLDPLWAPAQKTPVSALARDAADGSVYAAASVYVNKYSGSGVGAAITAPNWYPSGNSGVEINAMAVDGLGRLYIGGDFFQVNGASRSNLARLSANDTVDLNWNPAPTGVVRALALDANGNLVVGGSFASIGGSSSTFIARVSTFGGGAADPGWYPSANAAVYSLAVDASGDVFAGGYFTYIGAASRCNLARLSGSNGAAVAGWAAGTACSLATVSALALDGNGWLYANGNFTGAGSVAVNGLAKMATGSGVIDTAWKPAPDAAVDAVAIDNAGRVVAGGRFANIGGQLRSALAILPGDTEAIFRNGFEMQP